MDTSDEPAKQGFDFGYRRADFGGVSVWVPNAFADRISAYKEADAKGGELTPDHQLTDGKPAEPCDQAFPGLGLRAGVVPVPKSPLRADAPGHPQHEGLAAAMTEVLAKYPIRLCTPCVLPEVEDLLHAGLPELSVSVDSLGSHLTRTGPVGNVAAVAARVRRAKGALVSVSGCTGANRLAMAAVARMFPDRPIAIPMNAHHSVLNSAQACGVPVIFIGSQRVEAAFEAILPPSPLAIATVLVAYPEIAAVWVTSPSYEGVVANVPAIAEVVHHGDSQRLLVVDQAWGAHLGFSSITARSAVEHADLVTESTHKLGGAPNQAGLLLWNGDRVDTALLHAIYRAEVTTSPSFPLLAAIELALATLASPSGRARIRHAAAMAAKLAYQLRALSLSVLDSDRAGFPLDPLKVTVSTDGIGLTGYELAAQLTTSGIVVERAGLRSVVMIVNYAIGTSDIDRIVSAFRDASVCPGRADDHLIPPWNGHLNGGIVDLVTATRRGDVSLVPIENSVGMIACELVECYPPGIAVLVPGMPISKSAVDYLVAVSRAGGHVIGSQRSAAAVLAAPSLVRQALS